MPTRKLDPYTLRHCAGVLRKAGRYLMKHTQAAQVCALSYAESFEEKAAALTKQPRKPTKRKR
jgi:hypothetical protein